LDDEEPEDLWFSEQRYIHKVFTVHGAPKPFSMDLALLHLEVYINEGAKAIVETR